MKKTIVLLFVCIAACSKSNFNSYAAQVYDLSPDLKYGESYIVKPGDSLYYVAWHYGLDYSELARLNNIKAPYSLAVGQKLNLLSQQKTPVQTKSVATNTVAELKTSLDREQVTQRPKNNKNLTWVWPLQPKSVRKDSAKGSLHRGIDLGANYGALVKAAAKGVVVYTGSGIKDFGDLVIIKHSGDFLTAYGYNEKVLVKEGQRVKQGQSLAVLGHPPIGETRLHFEMRKHGKPLNPIIYLPKIKV